METAISILDEELHILLKNIQLKYQYDFSSYHSQNLKQSIERYLKKHGQTTLDIENPDFDLVEALWNHSSFFYRNEDVFLTLKDKVFPEVKKLDTIKIWHAACAQGEEVYSLAILLKEQGLLEKTEIFATDISEEILTKAQQATYLNTSLQTLQKSYQKAGGENSIADYFYSEKGFVKLIHPESYPIQFFQHDLLKDEALEDINLILCRNMLIYIEARDYQKILQKLVDSMTDRAFLCLGVIETAIPYLNKELTFFDRKTNIYQRLH